MQGSFQAYYHKYFTGGECQKFHVGYFAEELEAARAADLARVAHVRLD